MKKYINKKDDVALASAECHKLLKECISFDNIEDKELICKNLNRIKDYRSKLSDAMYSHIEKFVNETIKPIVYDVDYFNFLKRDEFGSYNDEGHFVINSDHSLEMMIFLMYEHTLELNVKLDEFVSKHLYLNIGN